MLKVEFVYRELLFQAIERKKLSFTQKELAERLGMSLSNVSHALKPLKRMNAVSVKPQGFSIVNAKKILYYWASIRELQEDMAYNTRAEMPVKEMEKNMPADAIFTAYSGYRLKFREAPADYGEVYVYALGLDEIRKRFPEREKNPNLFVLKKDELMESYGKTASIAQLFVDLWNLPEWYASDFIKALEARIIGLLE